MKRKWYYADNEDEKALEAVMKKYGLSTESDVIRLLLRLGSSAEGIRVTMPSENSKVVTRVKKSL
jgi:hypothetical protein